MQAPTFVLKYALKELAVMAKCVTCCRLGQHRTSWIVGDNGHGPTSERLSTVRMMGLRFRHVTTWKQVLTSLAAAFPSAYT
ncbi:protein of unknown function [Aminobacter niigataensis]|nr:protein of unknown function [Aminobacter niigataensis]